MLLLYGTIFVIMIEVSNLHVNEDVFIIQVNGTRHGCQQRTPKMCHMMVSKYWVMASEWLAKTIACQTNDFTK